MDTTEWQNPRLATRIIELDGVRGLAVSLIVGFHYFVQSTDVSQPWLVRLLGPSRLMVIGITLATIGVIAFAPLCRTILVMHGNAEYGPYTLLPCRADDLGMGVLLAIVCRNQTAWLWLKTRRRHLLVVFSVLTMGMLYLASHLTPKLISTIGYSWIGLFYSALILLLVVHLGAIARGFFRNAILTVLGKYSYAIYIFHYGIFGLCHFLVFHRAPAVQDASSLLVTLLALLLTIGCAALSWRFLEGPLIARAGRHFQYDRVATHVSGAERFANPPRPSASGEA